jgi:inhibitor of cysteine peptidase
VKHKNNFLSFVRMAALAGTGLIISSPGAVSCQKNENFVKMEQLLVAADNNRKVDIRLNETIRITLPENATTGYAWTIDSYDKALFSELPSEAHYPVTTAVGSGGEIVFIFQGKKTGKGDIMLKQWRSWEGDLSIIGRFHIRINVLP